MSLSRQAPVSYSRVHLPVIRAKYSVLVEVVASRHYVPGIKVCRVYGHGIRHSLLYVEDGLPPVPDSVETDVSRVLGISALGLI